MAIHFDALPGILLHPTETLTKLKKDANLADGLKLYLILAFIGLAINIVLSIAISSSVKIAGTKILAGPSYMLTTVLYAIIDLLTGLAIFLLLCWLMTKLMGVFRGKKADFGNTLGLLSYTGASFYLFIMLPLSIITSIALSGSIGNLMAASTGGNPAAILPWLGPLMAVLVVTILAGVWEWLIAGRAAAVANDTTWGLGIATVLLAMIIVLLIVVAVGAIIGITLVGLGAIGTTGLSVGGL